MIDNVVKKLLVLTSKILNDFSPAGISVEVSNVALVKVLVTRKQHRYHGNCTHVSKHQKHTNQKIPIILVGNLIESINNNFSFLIFCFVIACSLP